MEINGTQVLIVGQDKRFSRYRKNVLTLQYRYIRQNVVALRYVTRFRNVLKSLHRYNKIEIIELFLFYSWQF